MSSYQALLAERELLEQRIAAAREKEVTGAVAQINTIMADYGLTPEDLGWKVTGKARKTSPVTIKYRHPETGQTWSGRGRTPSWLGDSPEAFAVTPE